MSTAETTLVVSVQARSSVREVEGTPEADHPVSGCLVTVLRGDDEVAKRITDASGRASFALPAGGYQIIVRLPVGYRADQQKADVSVAEGHTNTQNFVVQRDAAKITGEVKLPVEDSNADVSEIPLVAVGFWQDDDQVAATAVESDGRYEEQIAVPGLVEIRPTPEVMDHGGRRLTPDVARLFVVAPPGAVRKVAPINYALAGATVTVHARRAGVTFDVYPGTHVLGSALQTRTTEADQLAVTFDGLCAGRYTVVATAPSGDGGPYASPRLLSSAVVDVQGGEHIHLREPLDFRPVDASEAVEPGDDPPVDPSPTDEERMESMPTQGDASGVQARMGELATITIHIDFMDPDSQSIVATPFPSSELLRGEAAARHLLNVQMRGELEERLEKEMRDTIGPDAILDALIVKSGSVEILIAIGLVLATVRDVNETVNAIEQLSGRALNIVRSVLRRMPRTTPTLTPHVVSGYWSRGALLLPARPATKEPARPGPRGQQVAQQDAGAPPYDTTRMFFIYLVLVNGLLITTLLALLFLNR